MLIEKRMNARARSVYQNSKYIFVYLCSYARNRRRIVYACIYTVLYLYSRPQIALTYIYTWRRRQQTYREKCVNFL